MKAAPTRVPAMPSPDAAIAPVMAASMLDTAWTAETSSRRPLIVLLSVGLPAAGAGGGVRKAR